MLGVAVHSPAPAGLFSSRLACPPPGMLAEAIRSCPKHILGEVLFQPKALPFHSIPESLTLQPGTGQGVQGREL